MNAQQAKEYAAANGFVISKTEDGKFRVVHTETGIDGVRSRYDGCGKLMEEITDMYKHVSPAIATGAELDAIGEIVPADAEYYERKTYGSGMVDAIEDFAPVPFEDMSDASKNRVRAIAATIREQSKYRFVLRVTYKKLHHQTFGTGFVLHFKTRPEAVKAVRRELSSNGKIIDVAIIEPV